MAEPVGGRRCGVCGRLIQGDDEWIALDGGEIWCAECWGQRFAAPTEAPKPAVGAATGQPAVSATETSPTTSPTELRPCSNCGHMCSPEMQTCPACGGEPWADGNDVAAALEKLSPSGRLPRSTPTTRGTAAPAAATDSPATQASVSAPFVSVTQGQPVGGSGPGTPVVHQINIGGAAMPSAAAVPQQKTSGLAVASFVLSLVGLFFFGFITGTLAVIFAGVAMARIRGNPSIKGYGLAVAGLIIGIVDIIAWIIVLIIWLTFVAALAAGSV